MKIQIQIQIALIAIVISGAAASPNLFNSLGTLQPWNLEADDYIDPLVWSGTSKSGVETYADRSKRIQEEWPLCWAENWPELAQYQALAAQVADVDDKATAKKNVQNWSACMGYSVKDYGDADEDILIAPKCSYIADIPEDNLFELAEALSNCYTACQGYWGDINSPTLTDANGDSATLQNSQWLNCVKGQAGETNANGVTALKEGVVTWAPYKLDQVDYIVVYDEYDRCKDLCGEESQAKLTYAERNTKDMWDGKISQCMNGVNINGDGNPTWNDDETLWESHNAPRDGEDPDNEAIKYSLVSPWECVEYRAIRGDDHKLDSAFNENWIAVKQTCYNFCWQHLELGTRVQVSKGYSDWKKCETDCWKPLLKEGGFDDKLVKDTFEESASILSVAIIALIALLF